MAYKMQTMWLSLSLCDGDGQYVEGFALEVNAMSLHCIMDGDMIFDIVHTDGEKERLTFVAVKGRTQGLTTAFLLGHMRDYIAGIRWTGEYPANMPISKDEYRARVGTGKLLNAQGHYA